MVILALVIAIALSTTIPTLVSVLAAKGMGLGVPTVDLGVWRPRLESRLGTSKLTFTPWLFASSYIIKDFSNLDLYANTPGKPFNSLNPMLRAAIIVCGPIFLLLFCMLILGPTTALSSFTSGFWQTLSGAVSPLGYAQTLLASFWVYASLAPLAAVAVVLTKFIAFSLMPLPSLSGGNAILQLVRWHRAEYPPMFGGLIQLGLLVVLLITVSWVVAFVWFLLHNGVI